ncbi:hypothetical protein FB451DRAFT_1560406, partial [Mycena latifolia]
MPESTNRQAERAIALRDWVSIPETNLPEPWTCQWAHWPFWKNQQPLEAVLSTRYAISDQPLSPIMFDGSGAECGSATLFACAQTNKFYLYHGPREGEAQLEEMYCFDGVFPSVEAFIDKADWNRMQKIEPLSEVDTNAHGPFVSAQPSPRFPSISERGYRVAATEPYSKR